MKTVKEVSRLTGVSVRTLHHYDAIDLLKPAQVTEAGYRLYDEQALGKLQTILLFRELEFPLREIRDMLSAEHFDPMEALTDQIRLLELRREKFDEVVQESQACILFYYWRNKWKVGAHFVALHKTDRGFVGYNTYSNSRGPDLYGPSLDGFLKERGYFGCVLMGISEE